MNMSAARERLVVIGGGDAGGAAALQANQLEGPTEPETMAF